jgi:ADP-heptose:LPS heptosyltransferase
MLFETAQIQEGGIASDAPLRIYTGILGQIGDIVMFTATARRLKELFPRGGITFAVSARYREAGELVAGLPYVDHLFVTQLYFERMTSATFVPWHLGWPVDLRGEDEVAVERAHDVVLPTRPRHRRTRWWEHAHQVVEMAHMAGVPGPIDLRTEVRVPPGTMAPSETMGKVVLHNDPAIDETKAWPLESVAELVRVLGPGRVVLLGNPGPSIPGALDYRGRTTLAQAAAIIQAAACYVGIDSGLMWIAGSLQVPAVGLYGTSYIPAYEAIQPENPNALYLQAEGPVAGIAVRSVVEAIERVSERAESLARAR